MFIFFSYGFHEQTHILTPSKENMVMFPLLMEQALCNLFIQ